MRHIEINKEWLAKQPFYVEKKYELSQQTKDNLERFAKMNGGIWTK